MVKKIFQGIRSFGARTMEDHMGAYAATCAYFLMLSFVPFIMILLAAVRLTPIEETNMMNAIISIVPAGLKSYVSTIVNEVYTKSYSVVPISVVILIWSASKAFHALTNGLNVISKVKETRSWFYIRFRSMVLVFIFILCLVASLFFTMFGSKIQKAVQKSLPTLNGLVEFLQPFSGLIGFIILLLVFLFIYKFLPNRRYTLRSQLPGALIVSTVWVFFSYFLSLYYEHDKNFNNIYGNLTGMVLSMIWLYFCMYFVLVGAELNRVIYEDPEDNVIVNTIQDVKEQSALRKKAMKEEIKRQKEEATKELPKVEETEDKKHTQEQNASQKIRRSDSPPAESTNADGLDLSIVREGVEETRKKLREEDNE